MRLIEEARKLSAKHNATEADLIDLIEKHIRKHDALKDEAIRKAASWAARAVRTEIRERFIEAPYPTAEVRTQYGTHARYSPEVQRDAINGLRWLLRDGKDIMDATKEEILASANHRDSDADYHATIGRFERMVAGKLGPGETPRGKRMTVEDLKVLENKARRRKASVA